MSRAIRRTNLDRAHEYARERGVLAPLYAAVRFLVAPVLRLWFRVRISGTEHIPVRGAAIIAPNHKSSLDAFFIGIATRRRVRYMAKVELFKWPLGWLLLRLGAFPVRRGEADSEAMETARLILEQGGLLVLFPEGTRVEDPHALGSPHHGAGRLALLMGAPIIPAAIAGTHKLWLGPVPKPRRVQLAFLPVIDPQRFSDQPDALSELIDRQLWPAVQQEYVGELARPGLILAALATIGVGGSLLARRRARAQARLLGFVEPPKSRRRDARRQLLARVRRAWRVATTLPVRGSEDKAAGASAAWRLLRPRRSRGVSGRRKQRDRVDRDESDHLERHSQQTRQPKSG